MQYLMSSKKASHDRTNPGYQAPVRRTGRSYGTTTTIPIEGRSCSLDTCNVNNLNSDRYKTCTDIYIKTEQ